ncbi:MAG: homoserine kinase [Actinomycetota bacterium]
MRLTATVPATSANLGPGFDCFALALDLCNEVTIDADAEPDVTWEGEGADELPSDGSDRVSRALVATAAHFERPLPSMSVHGRNRIPLQRGLGSSAAAAVAGVALADAALDLGLDRTKILEIAAELEGHPDNAAAAVFGGFTMVVDASVVARFDPDPELRPVLFVPDGFRISTEEARRALAQTIPREDAVSNAGHAALTAVALLHEPGLLPSAMRDRLHEDVRLGLVPQMREIFDRLREAGLAVCVSGSGPTLLAFERHDAVTPEPGDGWRVLRIPVRPTGVAIREG